MILHILYSVFLTVRLVIWAILVAVAWFEIIEKAPLSSPIVVLPQPKRVKPPKTVALTATSLQEHNTQEQQQAPRWPRHIPPIGGVSEMGEDESIDEWSIWDEGAEAPRVTPGVDDTTGAGAQHVQQQTPYHHPSPLEPNTLHADQARDKAHLLSQTFMGGNTDLIPTSSSPHNQQQYKKKKKKPFLTRKVEQLFIAPYAQKYEKVGYMMYKGSMRVEKGMVKMSNEMKEAVLMAGVTAVDRVTALMTKYIKFFGTVVILSVALLPLPGIHISLSF